MSRKENRKSLFSRASQLASASAFAAILVLVFSQSLSAQTPVPAATSPASKDAGGFSPGWTLGAKFEGDYSSDAGVYNVGTALGYNFSHHFGVDAGVPFHFISTPTSIKQNNPGAVSGAGIGGFFTDLLLTYPSPSLNYSSAIHLTAPTGDTKKGFSVGHATWNFTHHIDHAFGDWSPFLDAGVGNTILDTKFFQRPFMSFGYNAAFNGGLEYDQGPFSFQAGAYDVAPWGNQTVISRVFRCGSATKCNSGGPSHNRKGFTNSNVTTGGADLVRDNGYEAGIDFKPVYYLDFEFDYSRSVPLQLNNYSFGIGINLTSLVRPHGR
ncbi:MAG TPA: hypothetical protein VE263_19360 [Candidatus Angelobacter sp.]|nr:hypothetical protein [Candidatus Angelobacter sp.]